MFLELQNDCEFLFQVFNSYAWKHDNVFDELYIKRTMNSQKFEVIKDHSMSVSCGLHQTIFLTDSWKLAVDWHVFYEEYTFPKSRGIFYGDVEDFQAFIMFVKLSIDEPEQEIYIQNKFSIFEVFPEFSLTVKE